MLVALGVMAGCSSSSVARRDVIEPVRAPLVIPMADGALPGLCRRPALNFVEGRALLDTIAGELTASGTGPGPYVVERLPRGAGPRLASFAMRGDTAIIAIGDTVGGHSLYHELVHAWAARLAPPQAKAMVESVFAADRIADWEPEVTLWAAASYLSVVSGLARDDGFTTMSLRVTASALDTTHAGRLTRLYDATSRIVRREPVRAGARSIAEALDAIAASHWRYAGQPQPRTWRGETERRFILASEVLAYARERHCLRS